MHTTLRTSSLAAALLLSIGMTAAMAAPRAPGTSIQAQYEHERAACLSNKTGADQAVCLQDAVSARGAALRGQLNNPEDVNYRRNALERCQVFKGEDAKECRERILGAGGASISGSVEGGGVLRELVTIEPAPVPVEPVAPKAQ
ncbi:MAG: hypothetical protein ABI887_18615 [Burkholderiales bacterium]